MNLGCAACNAEQVLYHWAMIPAPSDNKESTSIYIFVQWSVYSCASDMCTYSVCFSHNPLDIILPVPRLIFNSQDPQGSKPTSKSCSSSLFIYYQCAATTAIHYLMPEWFIVKDWTHQERHHREGLQLLKYLWMAIRSTATLEPSSTDNEEAVFWLHGWMIRLNVCREEGLSTNTAAKL